MTCFHVPKISFNVPTNYKNVFFMDNHTNMADIEVSRDLMMSRDIYSFTFRILSQG